MYNSVLQDSILLTIRKMLGGSDNDEYFNEDIVTHVNSAFARLRSLGVGPATGFRITGEEETWDDFMPKGFDESIKSYIYLKVRYAFDPPSSSTVMTSIESQIHELEWILSVGAEGGY